MFDWIDTRAQAGRGEGVLRVIDAKRLRMDTRHTLGSSRDDPPTVLALVRAADYLSRLLYDASGGRLELKVRCEIPGDPGATLSTDSLLAQLNEKHRGHR